MDAHENQPSHLKVGAVGLLTTLVYLGLGVWLYVAGGALRIWPVFVLGRRFSGLVAIQPGHEVVTDGIYRRLRHPS